MIDCFLLHPWKTVLVQCCSHLGVLFCCFPPLFSGPFRRASVEGWVRLLKACRWPSRVPGAWKVKFMNRFSLLTISEAQQRKDFNAMDFFSISVLKWDVSACGFEFNRESWALESENGNYWKEVIYKAMTIIFLVIYNYNSDSEEDDTLPTQGSSLLYKIYHLQLSSITLLYFLLK